MITPDHDAGLRVRREVLGDEHVDRTTVNEVTEDFQELITKYAWGGIWTRPGLPRRGVTYERMRAGLRASIASISSSLTPCSRRYGSTSWLMCR